MKDQIVVKPEVPATESGILLPQTSAPMVGEVFGMGPQATDFKIGDKILFPKYIGKTIKICDDEFLVFSAYHILAKKNSLQK